MKHAEVEIVAKQMLRCYCPLSWPMAWEGSNEKSREGWRRSARTVIRALDDVRGLRVRKR